jgi:hypothetical protein
MYGVLEVRQPNLPCCAGGEVAGVIRRHAASLPAHCASLRGASHLLRRLHFRRRCGSALCIHVPADRMVQPATMRTRAPPDV